MNIEENPPNQGGFEKPMRALPGAARARRGAELEQAWRHLEASLANRERMVAESESRLAIRERELAEREALLVAREKLLARQKNPGHPVE